MLPGRPGEVGRGSAFEEPSKVEVFDLRQRQLLWDALGNQRHHDARVCTRGVAPLLREVDHMLIVDVAALHPAHRLLRGPPGDPVEHSTWFTPAVSLAGRALADQ